MKLIGLLSWYDESASWLSAAIASLAKVGVDHLVAVDGAYFLLQGGRARSGSEQHAAIVETAHALNMGVTLHTPTERWGGNEIEKRTFLFSLGLQVAEEGDWLVVMDADQVVTDCPPPAEVKAILERAEEDAAQVTFWERHDPQSTAMQRKVAQQFTWDRESNTRVRIFFRAVPGLHVEGNHYTYRAGDGRYLWGNRHQQEIVSALDLSRIRVEHRTWMRDKARHEQQYAYYRRREELGVERPRCAWCDGWSVRTVPWDWSLVHGTNDLASGWLEVCAEHEPKAWAESEQQLVDLVGLENVRRLKPGMLRLTQGKVPA